MVSKSTQPQALHMMRNHKVTRNEVLLGPGTGFNSAWMMPQSSLPSSIPLSLSLSSCHFPFAFSSPSPSSPSFFSFLLLFLLSSKDHLSDSHS